MKRKTDPVQFVWSKTNQDVSNKNRRISRKEASDLTVDGAYPTPQNAACPAFNQA
jgi:hypothetical protein